MPIYEYLCEGCGRISEVMQKISDPAPKSCHECGSRKIAKLVSRSAFQLKGGGWYSDLYASPKKDAASTAPKGGGDKPASDKAASGTPPAETSRSDGKPAAGGKASAPKAAPSKSASRSKPES